MEQMVMIVGADALKLKSIPKTLLGGTVAVATLMCVLWSNKTGRLSHFVKKHIMQAGLFFFKVAQHVE